MIDLLWLVIGLYALGEIKRLGDIGKGIRDQLERIGDDIETME